MKQNEFIAMGLIDKNGRLSMPMAEVDAFFRENKGARVMATFHVMPTATSAAMIAYYYKYVVPTITRAAYLKGDRKTQQDTDEWLREISPVCRVESVNLETGEYTHTLMEVAELGNSQLLEHLDFLKQYAAENYDVYVEDPRNL